MDSVYRCDDSPNTIKRKFSSLVTDNEIMTWRLKDVGIPTDAADQNLLLKDVVSFTNLTSGTDEILNS